MYFFSCKSIDVRPFKAPLCLNLKPQDTAMRILLFFSLSFAPTEFSVVEIVCSNGNQQNKNPQLLSSIFI